MALAALIFAYRDSDEAGAPLRATLPLAGRTLVERQARLAASVGARRIVLLVERMPAALTAAIDRLRQDKLDLVVARNAEEAAAAIDPNDPFLMVADGFIGDEGAFRHAADAAGPVLLTVPDTGFDDRYERIDGDARWSGLARLQGSFLRETAAMLRDWDLQSTLLRRAVQARAARAPADRGLIVEQRTDLQEAERQIMAGAIAGTGTAWADRLLSPLERLATKRLIGTAATAEILLAAAAGLAGISLFLVLFGFYFIALLLLLLAQPLDGIAARLSKVRMQDGLEDNWAWLCLPIIHGGVLAAFGAALMNDHGWGTLVLALVAIAFLFAGMVEQEGRRLSGAAYLADRKGMVLLLLPFGIFGQWFAGLAVLFGYAGLSFFWAQREAHRPGAPGQA